MKDYLVRATAADAQIRAFAATTRQMVETARQKHDTSPVVTAALGRLLTAGSMMGSMLKGEEDLLTLQVTGDGPMGGMTVTADSKGHVKGYANEPQVILPSFFLFHCFPEFPDFLSEMCYIGTENARGSRHKNAGSAGTQRRAMLLRNISVHL